MMISPVAGEETFSLPLFGVRPPQCGSRAAYDVRTRLSELSITCRFGLMLAAVAHDSIVKRGSDLRRQVFSAVRKAAQLMRSRLPRAKQAANGKEMSQRRPSWLRCEEQA